MAAKIAAKVVDISSNLNSLYHITDPVCLETLYAKELPLFEALWSNMISLVDAASPEARNQLVKENIEEPLKSYFNHGMVTKSKQNRSILPFVHLGKTSVKESLLSANKGDFAVPLTLKSCGVGGNNAPFMVCQAVSPHTPLISSRTYFFSSDAKDWKNSDLWVTQTVYNGMVEGVLAAIQTYSLTHDFDEAIERVLSSIRGIEDGLPEAVTSHLNQKEIIKVSIEAFDNQGRKQPLQGEERDDKIATVKCLSVVIYDMPSVEVSGSLLGSLMFSETFLDSTLQVYSDSGNIEVDSDYIVLTSQIPRVILWNLESFDTKMLPKEQVPLCNESVYLKVIDRTDSVPVKGWLSVYQIGLAVGWRSYGDTVITWEHIQSVQVYRGDTSDVCLAIIHHNLPHPHLYSPPENPKLQLVLFLHPKTKAYKLFNSQVLPTWKEESRNVVTLTTVPDYLVNTYEEQQSVNRMRLDTPEGIKARVDWASQLKRFFNHFEASNSIKSVTNCDVVDKILGRSEHVTDDTKIPITIISGIPGSAKDELANSIKKYTEEHNRWIVFNQRLDSASHFIPGVIHTALTSAVQSVKKKKGPSSRTLRILVITPGFTDVTEVVHAILGHPDPDVAASITIGAVTCCIDPYNTFVSHRLTFPVLLNQCHPGWVNNIVLSNTDKSDDVTLVRSLIRSVNPDVSIFVADMANITRSTEVDSILSTDAFNDPKMLRHRHLSLPSWDGICSVPLYPPMNEVILRFKPYLERTTLVKEIKALHRQSYDNVLTGNIYHIRGKTTFQERNESIEMQFTTKSNILNWTKLPPSLSDSTNMPNFMVFIGCQLDGAVLKDWLRKCTKRKYDRKPEKSIENLSEKEIQKIHEENHLSFLPDGWFYNGHSYVSMDGEKTDRHPGMAEFMENYVNEKNLEIQVHNSAVDENNSNDIFF